MAKTNVLKKICAKCNGTGKVMQAPLSWVDLDGNPVLATEVNCDGCGGTGKIIWGEMVAE